MLKQLQNIQHNLPNHLTLPTVQRRIDSKTIFSMTKIKSRLSEDKLLLEIRLPLISVENFQIFKMISVPTRIETHYAYIKPIQDYLIANLERDKYATLS